MTQSAKKHIKSLLRWSVAALGTWYVLAQLSWHDRALCLLVPGHAPVWETVVSAGENSQPWIVHPTGSDRDITVPSDAVVSAPDRPKMTVKVDGQPAQLLGVDLADKSRANALLIEDSAGVHWISPDRTDYQVTIPHPRLQLGVEHLVSSARQSFLFWSILIYPFTFLITSFRWHELLKAVDVRLSPRRTFVLNMVGCFYNTFMPGSSGGDVLKAYYVAKQTHHRMRAVMSVAVDRGIGLMALIILGGGMSAYAFYRWHIEETRQVALVSLAILLAAAAGLSVFYHPTLFRLSGMPWLIKRLPGGMQDRVHSAVEALHLYGRRKGLVLTTLLASFPVHIIVILSALFAGTAFGLDIPFHVYWTVVPVCVLVGSIPISPQGAGVMEYFAILLLSPLGCTAAGAIALTMSIRLVAVLWNLAGGVFVFRGGYHAPTASEQKQVAEEDEDQSLENAAV